MSHSSAADINPYDEYLFPRPTSNEAKLYTTNAARERWENMSALFGLIVSLEYLERAYVREGIDEGQYAPACTRLLAQVKTIMKLVQDPDGPALGASSGGPPRVNDVEHFMRLYKMDHPAAMHRLKVGVPATVEHFTSSSSRQSNAERAQLVAETTQAFITFMDALKLKFRAKDQLHPMLGDLMSCYARAEAQGGEGWEKLKEGRAKLLGWLISLNAMKASDEVDEEQARQLLFDTDAAYSAWFKSLQGP